MPSSMDPDTPLDYAVFRLTPTRTRCELLISAGGVTEKLTSGLLRPYLNHLQAAERQIPRGGYSIKLEVPMLEHNNNASWFTKGTVERFVQFVNMPELLERVSYLDAELIQLHESISSQSNNISVNNDQLLHTGTSRFSGGRLSSRTSQSDKGRAVSKSGRESVGSAETADTSESPKLKYLKIMETRYSTLQKELGMAFARAAAAGYNLEHMHDLLDFAEYFGAERLKEASLKFLALWKRRQEAELCFDDIESLGTAEASSVCSDMSGSAEQKHMVGNWSTNQCIDIKEKEMQTGKNKFGESVSLPKASSVCSDTARSAEQKHMVGNWSISQSMDTNEEDSSSPEKTTSTENVSVHATKASSVCSDTSGSSDEFSTTIGTNGGDKRDSCSLRKHGSSTILVESVGTAETPLMCLAMNGSAENLFINQRDLNEKESKSLGENFVENVSCTASLPAQEKQMENEPSIDQVEVVQPAKALVCSDRSGSADTLSTIYTMGTTEGVRKHNNSPILVESERAGETPLMCSDLNGSVDNLFSNQSANFNEKDSLSSKEHLVEVITCIPSLPAQKQIDNGPIKVKSSQDSSCEVDALAASKGRRIGSFVETTVTSSTGCEEGNRTTSNGQGINFLEGTMVTSSSGISTSEISHESTTAINSPIRLPSSSPWKDLVRKYGALSPMKNVLTSKKIQEELISTIVPADNERRLSVQDAICLFEIKGMDIQADSGKNNHTRSEDSGSLSIEKSVAQKCNSGIPTSPKSAERHGGHTVILPVNLPNNVETHSIILPDMPEKVCAPENDAVPLSGDVHNELVGRPKSFFNEGSEISINDYEGQLDTDSHIQPDIVDKAAVIADSLSDVQFLEKTVANDLGDVRSSLEENLSINNVNGKTKSNLVSRKAETEARLQAMQAELEKRKAESSKAAAKLNPLVEAQLRAEKLRAFKASLQQQKKEKEEEERKRLEELKSKHHGRVSSRALGPPTAGSRQRSFNISRTRRAAQSDATGSNILEDMTVQSEPAISPRSLARRGKGRDKNYLNQRQDSPEVPSRVLRQGSIASPKSTSKAYSVDHEASSRSMRNLVRSFQQDDSSGLESGEYYNEFHIHNFSMVRDEDRETSSFLPLRISKDLVQSDTEEDVGLDFCSRKIHNMPSDNCLLSENEADRVLETVSEKIFVPEREWDRVSQTVSEKIFIRKSDEDADVIPIRVPVTEDKHHPLDASRASPSSYPSPSVIHREDLHVCKEQPQYIYHQDNYNAPIAQATDSPVHYSARTMPTNSGLNSLIGTVPEVERCYVPNATEQHHMLSRSFAPTKFKGSQGLKDLRDF